MHDRKAVFHSRSFRPVKYNARPPSIEGKAVHSTPPALYRGRSGTGRKVAVHFSRFAPDTVRTSRYKGRAPRPIRWAPSLDCVHSIAPCTPYVNRFLEKILEAFFSKIMKTHARVGVRKTGENRRKQRFLAQKSFLKKSEKARKKDFFRRAARRFFENSAPCHAPPAPHPASAAPRLTGGQRTEYTNGYSIKNYIA